MSIRTCMSLAFAFMVLAHGAPAVSAGNGSEDPQLTFGGQVRVRGYTLENMWDIDGDADGDKWSVMRNRARIHARADLPRGVRGFVRIANQNWGTGVTGAEGDDRWEVDNKSGKTFVDAAWLEVDEAFGLPMTVRLGRQDLFYGSGLLIADGQSQLASTANYLDGAWLRWSGLAGTTVDLLHFKDEENARADAAHDDVTLSGVYASRRPAGGRGVGDLYALRRSDQALGLDVWTLGARLGRERGPGLDYQLEGALQGGDHAAGRTHEAFAGDIRAGYTFDGTGSPRPYASFVALSGDDPATAGTNERWDVGYGGWPRYDDLLAWLYINLGAGNAMSGYDPVYADGSSRTGEVVYGNLLMTTLGLDLEPSRDLRLDVSVSRLRAHTAPGGALDIGTYARLRARYVYSPQLTLSLFAAVLDPGDAYGPGADRVHELYWETLLSF